jgi:hypothetical protein
VPRGIMHRIAPRHDLRSKISGFETTLPQVVSGRNRRSAHLPDLILNRKSMIGRPNAAA